MARVVSSRVVASGAENPRRRGDLDQAAGRRGNEPRRSLMCLTQLVIRNTCAARCDALSRVSAESSGEFCARACRSCQWPGLRGSHAVVSRRLPTNPNEDSANGCQKEGQEEEGKEGEAGQEVAHPVRWLAELRSSRGFAGRGTRLAPHRGPRCRPARSASRGSRPIEAAVRPSLVRAALPENPRRGPARPGPVSLAQRAAAACQCKRCPGFAPASGLSRKTSPSVPAATTMPSLTPNFILRGARLAAITTRRPTSCSGS